MSKKSSSKKTTKTEDKNEGYVGILYDGRLKMRTVKLFWCESNVEDVYNHYRDEYYGKDVICKYLKCEYPDKVFNGVDMDLREHVDGKNLYVVNQSTIIDTLKKISNVKTIETIDPNKKKKEEKKSSDTTNEKKTSKKPTEQKSSKTSDKKESNKKTTNTKKDESDNDSNDESNDDSDNNSNNSDNESDDDSEDNNTKKKTNTSSKKR